MTGGGHLSFAPHVLTASGGLGERRVALAVTMAAIGLFVAFLALMPAPFPSFDEWKYFGIGYNLWAGRGLTTVFGSDFLLHGPIWSAIVTLPHVLFGVDSAAWGRLLNGLAGATIVSLAAWFGWRIRPSVGAFAAVLMVAIVYLHDQSRTARLDVPAATFALLYVALAFESIRRDSTRWAIAAGLAFAIGFLIKEIDLPFAPIPFLAATLWRVPWVRLVRVTAWSLLVASVGVSWWFVLYGLQNGRFYRLESPAWTLIPVAFLIGLLVVAGLALPRLSRSSAADRFAASAWGLRLDRGARLAVAWGGACVWAAAQLIAYSRTTRLKGGPLLSARQLDLYADQWIKPFWVAALVAAVGIALVPFALAACRSRIERSAVLDLIVAGVCGAPLVILVIGVG